MEDIKTDRIIYCSDIQALSDKLVADGFYAEETKSFQTVCVLTPRKSKDNTSLALARYLKLDLEEYPMLEDLGNYESIVLEENEDKLDKYKSVNPYDVPLKYKDENGNEVEYKRPFKIVGFL